MLAGRHTAASVLRAVARPQLRQDLLAETAKHLGPVRTHVGDVDLVEPRLDKGGERLDVACWVVPSLIDSRVESSVTKLEACSKCSGVGRTWDSSPGRPEFGQMVWARRTPSSSVDAQATLNPTWAVAPSLAALRKRPSSSASGMVLMYPSAIRAARSVDFGASPDMRIWGGVSGRV